MLKDDPRDITKAQYDLLPYDEQEKYEFMLYDTDYKVGGEEDVHLFLRIREKYQIVMSGYSCFWHKEGATRWNDDVLPGYKAKNKKIEESNYDRFTEKWGWDIRKEGLHFYEEILE